MSAAVAEHHARALDVLAKAQPPDGVITAVAAELEHALGLAVALEQESNRLADAVQELLDELRDLEGRT